MNTTVSVVRGLSVGVTCALTQLLFAPVVLLPPDSNESDNAVFYLCEMTHANVTVSDVVDVAVIVLTENPPEVDVDCVTPAENVAV